MGSSYGDRMGDEGPIPLEELATRLHRLRSETFGVRPDPEPEVAAVDAPVLGAPEPDKPPKSKPEVAEPVEVPESEDFAVKYAMEIAAHRDTTDKLLHEKDRTITLLRESVAELRAELDRSRNRVGEPDRP